MQLPGFDRGELAGHDVTRTVPPWRDVTATCRAVVRRDTRVRQRKEAGRWWSLTRGRRLDAKGLTRAGGVLLMRMRTAQSEVVIPSLRRSGDREASRDCPHCHALHRSVEHLFECPETLGDRTALHAAAGDATPPEDEYNPADLWRLWSVPVAVVEFLARTGELQHPRQHYVEGGMCAESEASEWSFVPLTPGVSEVDEEDDAGFV